MKRKLLLFLSFIILSEFFIQLNAQIIIHGVIEDGKGKPVQSANALLMKATDSSLVKGMICDASGKFSFENIKAGKYFVTATFTGMKQVFTKTFEAADASGPINLGVIDLVESGSELNHVTVTARKPMFEQKIDRMVINVKNSITDAGGTALDVLEKSPGVVVNRQNNSIAINGKNGVVVMINGRITYMPMDALVQMLAGMSAGNIEKIELITTPPAKYDAEGNAGYINIVLLNNPNAGVNGSYFLTAGYGKRELPSAGLNFNWRTGKLNLYGTYSFTRDHTIQTGAGFTQIANGQNIVTTNSFTHRNGLTQVHNLRLGADYQLDSSTIIGVIISGYKSHWSMTADNGAFVKTNNALDTTINTEVSELNHWQNFMSNINLQHNFKHGQVLFIDANYIYYKDNNPIDYFNHYYKGSVDFLYDENLQSGKTTPINFKVLSADFTTPLGKKITMEAGAKTSFSKFNNNVYVQKLNNGAWAIDSALSANYALTENIGAAYASFTMDVNEKTTLKAGLRYEYTYSNLGTDQTANIVNRKYGELFPTFYISQKLNDNNSINLSYSRRITRPTFNDLAPFTIFFDPKTFFTGNPALQPSIANSVQAGYVYRSFIFSLSYTHENNTIEHFQTQSVDSATNTVYLTSENFRAEQYVTASFSLPLTVNKWWTMQNNIIGDWRQVNTDYQGAPISLQVFDYSFNTTQHFNLPKNFSLELSGFYGSASFFGSYKTKPLYEADAGIQKKFKNQKDNLRFAATDIFNSGSHYRFTEQIPMQNTIITGDLNFGQIAFKLTWTHNFGNSGLKDKRSRATGAEEELNRVHN